MLTETLLSYKQFKATLNKAKIEFYPYHMAVSFCLAFQLIII